MMRISRYSGVMFMSIVNSSAMSFRESFQRRLKRKWKAKELITWGYFGKFISK